MEIVNELAAILFDWPKTATVFSIALAVIVWRIGPRRLMRHRHKPAAPEIGAYFTDADLMTTPKERPAYSDRTAYMLAEMADLAYYEFERESGLALRDSLIRDLVSRQDAFSEDEAELFFDTHMLKAMTSGHGTGLLSEVLRDKGFTLLETMDKGDVQGFICRREPEGSTPYLIVAFRGSEAKVDDWYTNVQAVPEPVEGFQGAKVHGGFLKSFRRVEQQIRDCIDGDEGHDASDQLLPVYFTGHSLGGALAVLAMTIIAPDRGGGCYTFGAPRVANYELFEKVKTPMFRVVNSSDIVPRMPPSLLVVPVLSPLLKFLAETFRMVPYLPRGLEWLARVLDKLKDYRHFGDQRYLTDISSGRFEQTKLLLNPPLTDRAWWLLSDVASEFLRPVNSHSMKLYRQKLRAVAHDRQQR